MTRKDKHYQNRYDMIRNLSRDWIRLHRPDVAEQIEFEAEKLYPRPVKGYTKNRVPFPQSLQKMK